MRGCRGLEKPSPASYQEKILPRGKERGHTQGFGAGSIVVLQPSGTQDAGMPAAVKLKMKKGVERG